MHPVKVTVVPLLIEGSKAANTVNIMLLKKEVDGFKGAPNTVIVLPV